MRPRHKDYKGLFLSLALAIRKEVGAIHSIPEPILLSKQLLVDEGGLDLWDVENSTCSAGWGNASETGKRMNWPMTHILQRARKQQQSQHMNMCALHAPWQAFQPSPSLCSVLLTGSSGCLRFKSLLWREKQIKKKKTELKQPSPACQHKEKPESRVRPSWRYQNDQKHSYRRKGSILFCVHFLWGQSAGLFLRKLVSSLTSLKFCNEKEFQKLDFTITEWLSPWKQRWMDEDVIRWTTLRQM